MIYLIFQSNIVKYCYNNLHLFIIMVFACQVDSYLKEFTSTVVSCTSGNLEIQTNGKKSTISGYEIIMEDTILFPEGGGQPCDKGYLNDIPVVQVNRRGSEAIHFIGSPLPVGEKVKQVVDWERRQDHMQQHSGQHLISAIGETEFNAQTTAWWLGDETCYIELDTTSLTQLDVDKWENIVNEKIRLALPVTVTVYKHGDPWLEQAHTKGLPKDHEGDVRVITIEGVDDNMCCGTHVTNLAQLQAIKLLFFEKGKKNKTNLHFIVGGRVIKYLAKCLEREKKLTDLLQGGPASHADLVDKLQKSVKVTNKNLQTVLKDLVSFEVEALKKQDPKPKYFCLHRKEADSDFMLNFIKTLNDQEVMTYADGIVVVQWEVLELKAVIFILAYGGLFTEMCHLILHFWLKLVEWLKMDRDFGLMLIFLCLYDTG